MKLKLMDIVGATEGLKELGALKLSAKLSYAISKNIRHLQAELEDYQKLYNSLITEKYGEQKDGGFQVKQENMEAFAKEVNELLATEVDIDIYPIALDDSIILSVTAMYQLNWMFLEPTVPVINKE
jgi:hypothetical protein